MEIIKANFKDGVIKDGYMWVFDNLIQAICRIALDTYEMELVASYEGKVDFEADWLLDEKDSFFLVSRQTSKIIEYNKSAKLFIEKFEFSKTKDCILANAFIYENIVWLIPLWIKENVYCYDTQTGVFFTDNDMIQKVRDYKGNKRAFCRWSFLQEGVLWATIWCGSAYMKYDLQKRQCDIYELKDKTVEAASICYDGEYTWISQFNSGNVIFISEDNEHYEIERSVSQREPYSTIADMGECIVILPSKGDELIVINKSDLALNVYSMDYGESAWDKNGNLYLKCENYVVCMDKMYMFPSESKELFVFDSTMKVVKRVELICDFNYQAEKIRRFVVNNRYIKETEAVGLDCLLNWKYDER